MIVEHHPYAISVLLKLGNNFKADVFRKIGLQGTAGDWEKLTKKLIEEFEEENSGIDLFKFDSDEDVFCIFSEYIDDLIKLTIEYLIPVCNDEKAMLKLLTGTEKGEKFMLTQEQVKEINRKLAKENGIETDDSDDEISSIVYRIDVFGDEDPSMIDRHIDIEYSFGDYYEIAENSPLFEYIQKLCDLPLSNEELEITIWEE